MSLRPVVLNLGVQALASLLHFRTFFVPIYQIRAEQIEFVIQSDELTHQFVLHLAVHQFIVSTIAVTRLGAYNADERLQVAYLTCAIALRFCELLFASASG